jgi:proline iminopeptidase
MKCKVLLKISTLTIDRIHDTMNQIYIGWMSSQVQKGRGPTCYSGHITQYDDPETYFTGFIKFIKDLDNGTF